MDESGERTGGQSTPKYMVIRANISTLILNFEPVLQPLATKCFEKRLINEMSISGKTEREKATSLTNIILKKIEVNVKWYDVFYSIAQEFPELKDIAEDIGQQLKEIESGLLQNFPSKKRKLSASSITNRRSARLQHRSRRSSQSKRSTDKLPTLSPQSDKWQKDLQDTEVSDSREKIVKLERDLAGRDTKIKQLEMELKGKSKVINDLSKKYDEMKEIVAKQNEKIKKLNDLLQAKVIEAKDIQAKNESMHKSYKEQIEKLQKQIEELKSENNKAQLDLGETRLKLREEELNKRQIEINYREEIQERSKIQDNLEQTIRTLEEKKNKLEREKVIKCLIHEKEIAVKDKEMAVKDKEMALKDTKLAEEKMKVAQISEELAQRRIAELQNTLEEMSRP